MIAIKMTNESSTMLTSTTGSPNDLRSTFSLRLNRVASPFPQVVLPSRKVTSDRSILVKIKTDACAGTEYAVNYLEHVQAVISVNATRRGDLELFLTSPMGTRYDERYILSLLSE